MSAEAEQLGFFESFLSGFGCQRDSFLSWLLGCCYFPGFLLCAVIRLCPLGAALELSDWHWEREGVDEKLSFRVTYPRSCGACSDRVDFRENKTDSPPLLRGRQRINHRAIQALDSSPRLRGVRWTLGRRPLRPGFIPALAGSPLSPNNRYFRLSASGCFPLTSNNSPFPVRLSSHVRYGADESGQHDREESHEYHGCQHGFCSGRGVHSPRCVRSSGYHWLAALGSAPFRLRGPA